MNNHCRSGFTAIEVLVAIFILSMVGLLVGQTLMKTGQSATKTRESQKAGALADMVLEQYTAYAAHDYHNLPSYNQINATPQTFFGTKDNLGYDNLRITSQTNEQENGGALVTVTISWGAGTQTGSMVFTKTFAETTGGGGGAGHTLSGI